LKTVTSISKRTRRIAAVAAVLLLVASAAMAAVATGQINPRSLAGAAVAGSTCNVPSGGTYSYPTIQAALNDAGCATINLAAGTYQENLTIARAVIINGASASSTIVHGTMKGPVFLINQPVAVTFNGLTITGGFADGRSGGIDVRIDANVTVMNSILSKNTAFDYQGGAICICHYKATLSVQNSTFLENHASPGQGGAIWSIGKSLTVTNSTFSRNTASLGGAILASGSFTLSNNTFSANRGDTGGAVVVDRGASATITNSTFYNNQALDREGGAIYTWGTVNLSSSTFSNNEAYLGSTLVSNNGTINLKSTIIANGPRENCRGGGFNDRGNNLRWPASDTSCVGAYGDPKLGALADNGGATQTMGLQANSAAIDTGSCNDASGAAISADQRGAARSAGWTCDIGAFESGFKLLRAGLLAHWKFDEGSGSTTYDSAGNGWPSRLENGASFATTGLPAFQYANPAALALRGSSHQYTNAQSGLNLANSSFTVAAWAKRSITSGKQWILSQGTKTTDQALVLGFRDTDRFTCAFYSDDLDTPNQYTDTNQWHHWACTFDAATRTRTIYRDGAVVATDTAKGMFQASGSINIGRATWNEGYFSGAIDDVRFYNRPLSAAELQWLATGNP
jgi:predicted outer membrane repeat protein